MVTPWKVVAGTHQRMLIYYSQFENSFDNYALEAETREMEVKKKK